MAETDGHMRCLQMNGNSAYSKISSLSALIVISRCILRDKVVIRCTGVTDILKYVRRETAPAAAALSQTSDASVEWLDDDDDDELLSSEHLSSIDSDASCPKKPKIR